MDLIEKARVIHYHRHRIDVYRSGTVEALGWRSKDSQAKRFEVLASVGDLSGCSLLDLGCGYGDLKAFLDGRFSGFTYIGIDQMPDFITVAQERYAGCADTYFYQTDFTTVTLPQVDYVFASGALAYRCGNPDFYRDVIRKMYQASTKAAAFNMLDADHFPEHQLLVGHDSEKIASFCRELSPRVKIIKGYLKDDFTVFMYR